MVTYIAPFRGDFKTVERFLQSLFVQTSNDWQAHVIDDASEMSSEDRNKLHVLVDQDPRIFLHENHERLGPLHNVYNVVVNQIKDDEAIIAQADGDDWLLPNATVLIKSLHKSFDVTYGQFLRFAPNEPWHMAPGQCSEYPPIIQATRKYEDHPWIASHLKTFKRKVFMEIPYECFIDPRNGDFWNSSYDKAYMLPILKLTHPSKVCFNSVPIYVYNMEGWGVTNDHVKPSVQKETSKFIVESVKLHVNEEVRWHEDPNTGSPA